MVALWFCEFSSVISIQIDGSDPSLLISALCILSTAPCFEKNDLGFRRLAAEWRWLCWLRSLNYLAICYGRSWLLRFGLTTLGPDL